MNKPRFISLLALLLLTQAAHAHSDHGAAGGFVSGLTHPVTGPDHVVAMVAVGLWGAFLGKRAMWALPVIFPMVMALGGALGVLGVPLPFVEAGIALSGVVLGLMVLFVVKPPLWVAAALVGIFAVFHGHAHGTELPESASPLTYAIGFVISTGLLHLCGIGFGMLTKWPAGVIAVRAGGAVIAVIGALFLFGVL
jgi:urease accessory protein